MNKITVITPTWNLAEFIRDTIESVIHQTHREICLQSVSAGREDRKVIGKEASGFCQPGIISFERQTDLQFLKDYDRELGSGTACADRTTENRSPVNLL